MFICLHHYHIQVNVFRFYDYLALDVTCNTSKAVWLCFWEKCCSQTSGDLCEQTQYSSCDLRTAWFNDVYCVFQVHHVKQVSRVRGNVQTISHDPWPFPLNVFFTRHRVLDAVMDVHMHNSRTLHYGRSDGPKSFSVSIKTLTCIVNDKPIMTTAKPNPTLFMIKIDLWNTAKGNEPTRSHTHWLMQRNQFLQFKAWQDSHCVSVLRQVWCVCVCVLLTASFSSAELSQRNVIL